MKRNIIFIWLMVILLAGCYKDKGNYDYIQLPEISVSGLENKEYIAYVAEPFRIPVTVEITNGVPADLSYEWKLEGKVISTEKDLDVITDFPVKSGMYAQLDVIDNNTQVRYISLFKVSVSSAFASGWMILSDLGEKSQLCFMRNDNVFVENIYHLQNGEYLSAGAYAMCEHFLQMSPNTGQIFIACQKGPGFSVELDGSSLQKVINTEKEFIGGAPRDFAPSSMNCMQGYDYLISAGKLYTREQPNGMDAQYQEGSFPNFPVPGDYELLPWTMVGHPIWNFTDVLAFDKKTCSYVLLRNGEIRKFDTSSDEEKAFEPSNMGKMLLGGGPYLMASRYDYYLTFVRDVNTGQVFVQKFCFNGYGNRRFYTVSETEFPETSLIQDDTKFAICTNRKYVYFTSGKALYSYNYEEDVVSLLRDDFSGSICDIALNRTNNERLAIAMENADDSSKSDFMILDVSVIGKGKTVEGTEVKGKCGRVVDILYKVGNQWNVPYN